MGCELKSLNGSLDLDQQLAAAGTVDGLQRCRASRSPSWLPSAERAALLLLLLWQRWRDESGSGTRICFLSSLSSCWWFPVAAAVAAGVDCPLPTSLLWVIPSRCQTSRVSLLFSRVSPGCRQWCVPPWNQKKGQKHWLYEQFGQIRREMKLLGITCEQGNWKSVGKIVTLVLDRSSKCGAFGNIWVRALFFWPRVPGAHTGPRPVTAHFQSEEEPKYSVQQMSSFHSALCVCASWLEFHALPWRCNRGKGKHCELAAKHWMNPNSDLAEPAAAWLQGFGEDGTVLLKIIDVFCLFFDLNRLKFKSEATTRSTEPKVSTYF